MKSIPRGLCLIINNVNFASITNLTVRDGSIKDEEKLDQVFSKILRFDVKVQRDVTAEEMTNEFDKIRNDDSLKDLDSFACIIMSHGGVEDQIYGIDGEAISVHEVTKKFNDENCIGLRGKPKLFFINACRGGKTSFLLQLNIILN